MTWPRKLVGASCSDSANSGQRQYDSGDSSNPSITYDSKQGLGLPPAYSPYDPKMLESKSPLPCHPFLFPLLDEKHDDIQLSFTTRVPKKVLQRITMHLGWVDQSCLARASKSFYNVIQLLRWDSSAKPRSRAENSLAHCLYQRDDPANPSCAECQLIFARVVDGLGTTHATTANGWSFLLTGDHCPSTFMRQIFKHLLPQCLASPKGSIQLTRGKPNWIQSERVEADIRLVHVNLKAVVVTRWMIPERDVYHAVGEGYRGQSTLMQLFTGIVLHLCAHIEITNFGVIQFCACSLTHEYGIPCVGCNYPLCCSHCKTEVERSREVLPDGRKSLVITTWRNLGRLDESPIENTIWTAQWKDYRDCRVPITRSALLRSQVRAVEGPPVVMEERGLRFLISPGRKVSVEDPSRWSNIP